MYYGIMFPRRVIPFIYLIISGIISKNVDSSGHMCGIVAALIIKYLFVYQLGILPQQKWIEDFEETFFGSDSRFAKFLKDNGYYRPLTTEIIGNEHTHRNWFTATFENYRKRLIDQRNSRLRRSRWENHGN